MDAIVSLKFCLHYEISINYFEIHNFQTFQPVCMHIERIIKLILILTYKSQQKFYMLNYNECWCGI